MGEPGLPAPRGEVSAAVLDALRGGGDVPTIGAQPLDPYGEDLQLALYCLYELHYRGFARVDPDREWDPALLALRRELEEVFLAALRADTATAQAPDVDAEIEALLDEPPDAWGVSHHLRRHGQRWQLREYVVHRSAYHLKEADPQAFVIPRLCGAAKAGLVTVEHDEYGAGDPLREHARLFADLMRALDLCTDYGHHLDAVPAPALAEVNFMSLAGLHRRWRGALVGQFAVVELTSSPGSDRLAKALRRLGVDAEFYDEHVEADAVHEQLVRRDVIAPLLAAEPALATDVVFGMRAATLLAGRFGEYVLARWAAGSPSLRVPLPDAPHP